MDALFLSTGSVKSLKLARGGRVVCREGKIWLTAEGDLRDYVLGPGESYTAPGNVLVVMEDLSSSTGSLANLPLAV